MTTSDRVLLEAMKRLIMGATGALIVWAQAKGEPLNWIDFMPRREKDVVTATAIYAVIDTASNQT